MSSKRSFCILVLGLMIPLFASCSKTEETSAPAGPQYKPTGNEGNISGTIAFSGNVPAPRKMDLSQDPACEKMGEAFFDDVIVNDGKLQNVFVYVKSGLPKASFETPAVEVVLDQKGCKYVPRVLGIQTGQPLKITNSDPTDHNIHPVPQINNQWDHPQLAGQSPIVRKFVKEEVLIKVKCNKHPWMLAMVGVLAHPFFSVSKPDGTFAINGLPPGEYEIEAWHEKYGAKTMKVKVAEKSDTKADFTFNAATAYSTGNPGNPGNTSNPGSLKIQPAIAIP